VLHATDEIVTEFATELYDAPLHVVALRTERAKYAIYSDWHDHSIEPLRRGQDRELYDYRSHSGRLELDNSAGSHPLEESLDAQLERALREELRGALPARLGVARELGFNDYFSTARHVARVAAARRRQRERRFLGTAGGELPPNAQLRG
jgi:hypothetical protein